MKHGFGDGVVKVVVLSSLSLGEVSRLGVGDQSANAGVDVMRLQLRSRFFGICLPVCCVARD